MRGAQLPFSVIAFVPSCLAGERIDVFCRKSA